MARLNIVMAAYNNWDLTKGTIQSVLSNTDGDYKFIVVNNGSTETEMHDMVLEFLENEEYNKKIHYIKVEENGGCGIGRNRGMRETDEDCEYLILIDNDIIVTKNWSKRLIKLMDKHTEIGLAGPSTNFAGSPQIIKNAPRKMNSIEEIESFSLEISKKRGEFSYVPERWPVIGFCMIIRREVIDKIGLFDEEFKLYGCEDNDYCWRTQQAGWKLAYIHNIFIYHHGHGGLGMLGAKGTQQWTKNREYFKQKHGFI